MNKIGGLVIFVVGGAIGAFAAQQYFKKYYEQLAHDEIESMREYYLKKKGEEDPDMEFIVDPLEELTEEEVSEIETAADMREFAKILRDKEYTNYSDISSKDDKKVKNEEKEEPTVIIEKPYVIPPEDFGEFEDYETIELIFFADGFVTDDKYEIVDDADDIIGLESLKHFGEYDDDTVCVRNDRTKCDYEIVKDPRKLFNVLRRMPDRMEE